MAELRRSTRHAATSAPEKPALPSKAKNAPTKTKPQEANRPQTRSKKKTEADADEIPRRVELNKTRKSRLPKKQEQVETQPENENEEEDEEELPDNETRKTDEAPDAGQETREEEMLGDVKRDTQDRQAPDAGQETREEEMLGDNETRKTDAPPDAGQETREECWATRASRRRAEDARGEMLGDNETRKTDEAPDAGQETREVLGDNETRKVGNRDAAAAAAGTHKSGKKSTEIERLGRPRVDAAGSLLRNYPATQEKIAQLENWLTTRPAARPAGASSPARAAIGGILHQSSPPGNQSGAPRRVRQTRSIFGANPGLPTGTRLYDNDGDNDGDGDGDDCSNFSETEAEERKKVEDHNRIADQLPWGQRVAHYEEQDAEDLAAMIQEIGGQSSKKDKGKQKASPPQQHSRQAPPTPTADGGGSGSAAGQDDTEDRDDDDDDDDDTTPWELTPGPLSKEDLKEVLAARRNYHAVVETVARRSGKRVSSIFKAVGDHKTTMRHPNPWNAFQVKYRTENPKPSDMSAAEFKKQMHAAYQELFSALPEDEQTDREARRKCLEPVMEWYQEKTTVVADARKASGHGAGLLDRAIQPFVHQASSTITYQTSDIDIFGFAVDPFADLALVWGGSPGFFAVQETYEPSLKVKLQDIKAMFQFVMVYMAKREAEANESAATSAPPIAIAFGKKATDKNKRDARRRELSLMFLNQILVALRARGEDTSDVKKMAWKWADFAVKKKLRIENWPTELKTTFPSAGFALNTVTGKEATKALEVMGKNMEERYGGGEDDGTGVQVVSWTEDEMELEDADATDVALVTCADGTTLLTAKASKNLLKGLKGKAGKRKAKQAASDDDDDDDDADDADDDVRADGNGDDEDEDDDSAEKSDSAQGKRGNKRRASNAPLPPAKRRKGRTAASTPVASTSKLPAAPSKTLGLKCRYTNKGVMSDTFIVKAFDQVDGPPTYIDKHTLFWTASDDGGSWKALPPGVTPRFDDGQSGLCLVLRASIALSR
ncbi:hypothetical protein B0H11DRAFT_2350995 [Mycena galericulata]|nr:hypothetical protein B0H11DRAFT_2350995 [Mycena galericulata]